MVRFEGVFLRSIRYQGGDSARLAPLVVGDRPPSVTAAASKPAPTGAGAKHGAWGNFSGLDWALGLGAAVVVVAVLARHHLRRPSRRPLRLDSEFEPPPEFNEPV
jgi:hypothetical protein